MDPKLFSSPGDVLFARDSKPSSWLPLPALRFVRFIYLFAKDFSRNRCPEKAAALGFETVLSFIPALLLSLFFLHSVGGMENLSRELPRQLLRSLNIDQISLTIPAPAPAFPSQGPPTAVNVKLSDEIQHDVEEADRSLRASSVSMTSFLGLALAAIFLTLTLEHSLNDIWASSVRRPFLLKIALSWSILTLGPLVVGISIYLTRGLAQAPAALDWLFKPLGPFAVLYMLYKFVPAAPVEPRAAFLGAAAASAGWLAARTAFGYYLQYAVNVDRLYGALGLLPLLLIWIWVVWMIVLSGAELAYTYQNLARMTAKERRRRLAPFVLPGLTALGLVLRAAQAFRAGQGAVAGDELAEAAGLPDRLWSRLVGLLVEKRLLIEAGRDGQSFALARPCEALLVEEIFTAVEDALVTRPEENWPAEHNPLRGLSLQLNENRRRELGTKTVAELLDAGV